MFFLFILFCCVGYTVSDPCSNDRIFWLQPYFESCTINEADTAAWCYPTAAATLLRYKALKGDWYSSLYTNKTYPKTENEGNCTIVSGYEKNVTFQDDTLWADMIYHKTNNSLNMGHYMSTSVTAGTTLENGKIGIENFVAYANVLFQANVTDYNLTENDVDFLFSHKDKLPFLLHLNQNCMGEGVPYFSFSDGVYKREIKSAENSDPSVFSLGHTVLVYDVVLKNDNTSLDYLLVASNLKEERAGKSTRTCDGMRYKFPGNASTCIKALTTIDLVVVNTPETSTDSPNIGLIVGLSVGGFVLLAGIVYLVVFKERSQSFVILN